MAQDIATVQRDLANLQKQSKQLSDKIKTEADPNRKAILQKKLIDLNTKKANLNKEMEDAVTSIGAGQELELEGFIKWNKYRKLKMTKNKLTEANDTDIDLSKPFAVIAVGGSIGDNKTNYIPKYKGKVYKTFDDVNDAKTYASRYRKMLSKGEKTYYGMSYKVVKLTPSDINSMQTESKLPKNKLTEAEKLKIKKFAKGLVEKKVLKEATPSSMDERIIHVDLKLTQREYSELIGAIWDRHSEATGPAKKEILRSLKDKFEKYYK